MILIDKNEISVNEANLKLLKSMLKYKVIDSHTMEQIIVLDKLRAVKNVNSILES